MTWEIFTLHQTVTNISKQKPPEKVPPTLVHILQERGVCHEVTRLQPEQIQQLAQICTPEFDIILSSIMHNPQHHQQFDPRFEIINQLIILLIWLRQYPFFSLLSFIVWISQSALHSMLACMIKMVDQSVPDVINWPTDADLTAKLKESAEMPPERTTLSVLLMPL